MVGAMWRRKDGFTFLELAVVVAIMGVMMAISLPRFTSTFSKATLGGTARHLAGTMGYLRNAAASHARSYFLCLDLDNNQYGTRVMDEKADLSLIGYQEYDVLDDEIFTDYADEFVSKTKLEKKIAFARVMLGDGTEVFNGTVSMEFRPDGTADEATIYLTDPKQRVYIVYLEHYNGQARVYKREDLVPRPLFELTEREPPRRPRDAF